MATVTVYASGGGGAGRERGKAPNEGGYEHYFHGKLSAGGIVQAGLNSGNGGNPGSAGSNGTGSTGGAAGSAIEKGGNTVGVTNNGTISGAQNP